MSDIIKTTSDLFSPLANIWKTKSYNGHVWFVLFSGNQRVMRFGRRLPFCGKYGGGMKWEKGGAARRLRKQSACKKQHVRRDFAAHVRHRPQRGCGCFRSVVPAPAFKLAGTGFLLVFVIAAKGKVFAIDFYRGFISTRRCRKRHKRAFYEVLPHLGGYVFFFLHFHKMLAFTF